MPISLDAIKAHHGAFAKEGEVRVKVATIKTPSIDREQRIVKGNVGAAVPDLDSEVVLPAGLDTFYFPDRVKAVYFGHNYDAMPVGTCRSLAVRDGGKSLYASTYILPGAKGDDLLTAMEHGAISGFSIGFMPEEFGPPTPEEVKAYGHHTTIVRKGMLLEYSITAMPCNPDALVDLVSKSLIHRSSAVAFGLPDSPERRVFAVTERKVFRPRRVLKIGA
jgi:HK97 family phage prohead protease